MRTSLKSVIITIVTTTLLLLFVSPVMADIYEDLQKNLAEQERINKLLSETISKETTLKSQISSMNNQIRLTELKIEEAKNRIDSAKTQIESLGLDINVLSSRVGRIEESVNLISSVSAQRVRAIHQANFIPKFLLLFDSEGLDKALSKYSYLDEARKQDIKLLKELKERRDDYNDKKRILSEKKQQVEELKVQVEKEKQNLEFRNNDLAKQKKEKDDLLVLTKNDEARYQGIIKQLKAEADSIRKAITNIGAVIGPVKKGQVIAAMGSTGCSTGPHLHFEVFENAKVADGAIIGTRANPHKYLDNGSLGAPVQGYGNSTIITTEYGETYGVFGYPSVHTGLDIAPSSYEVTGRPILASGDGTAYSTSAPCSYSIQGGSAVGKGVVIDHKNGLVTLYWHIL